MEKQSRRKFSADFKTKVVLEAIKERYTIEEIARKYEIHPNQIHLWNKEFLSKASGVFDNKDTRQSEEERQAILDRLYSQIGQQKVEIDWLKKKLL
jgi:transposase